MRNDVQITAGDAEVLKYFRKHSPASASDAEKALPDTGAVEHRIAALTKLDVGLLSEDVDTDLSGTRELHRSLGVYRITPKGEIALDDYLVERKRHRRELFLKSVWMPILVSIAVNLTIAGIRQLWPLIQQWLSNTPA